jgi:hypothetical protein
LTDFLHIRQADFNGEHLSYLNKTNWPIFFTEREKGDGRRELAQRGVLPSLSGQVGSLCILCAERESRIACLAIPATFAAGNIITKRPLITDSAHGA